MKIIGFLAALFCALAFLAPAQAAPQPDAPIFRVDPAAVLPPGALLEAAHRGTTIAVATVGTCPNGLVYAQWDDCQNANANALFQSPTLVTDYVKDANGNTPASLGAEPGIDYNMAGRAFPVGPIAPWVYNDPYFYSATFTGSISATTLTISTLTQGYVDNGMTLFTSAGGNITDHPVTSSCSGHTVTPITCTLSKNEGTKSGSWFLSFMAPWHWSNGGTGLSSWLADYRYPNQQLTSTFDHMEFASIGGHTPSTMRITAQDNGFFTLIMTNNHIKVESASDGTTFLGTSVGLNGNVVFKNNECDGGNAGTPVNSPPASIPFNKQTSCFNWSGRGLAGGGANIADVTFEQNYIHDWAGNPISIDQAYNCITSQANVWINNGINNGTDTSSGYTGLHGASITLNTTAIGAHNYCLNRWNDVVAQPYGFRQGVTTGPFAALGGAGSAIVIDSLDFRLNAGLSNVSAVAGKSTISNFIDIFRTGAVTRAIIQKNYNNNIGMGAGGCFNLGGDVQGVPGQPWVNASMTASTGNRYSVWSVSGLSGQIPLPYPGQGISTAAPSGTIRFIATETDNLDGTSHLHISSTQVGSSTSLANGVEVKPLRANADPRTNPILIISQQGPADYTVSNGTGSGETHAAQSFFYAAQTLQAFGAHGTTATGGTTEASFNGTYAAGGEQNVALSGFWNAVNAYYGSVSTIDADILNNKDIISGQDMTVDGPNWAYGACPNTSSN